MCYFKRVTYFRNYLLLTLIVAFILLAGSFSARASFLRVSLDTSGLLGTQGILAFDFTDANSATNTVIISHLVTDGTFGAATAPLGGVAGALADSVVLVESDSILTEFLQDITFGHVLSFNLDLTETVSGESPFDALSVFLLGDTASMPLFKTTDTTGADALFSVDIDGKNTGFVQVFDPIGVSGVSWNVNPQDTTSPATLWLLVIGYLSLITKSRFKYLIRV